MMEGKLAEAACHEKHGIRPGVRLRLLRVAAIIVFVIHPPSLSIFYHPCAQVISQDYPGSWDLFLQTSKIEM